MTTSTNNSVRNYMPDVVLYHFPCTDGYTSRWIIEWLLCQYTIEEKDAQCVFVPYNYQNSLPVEAGDVAGRHILFVDCCPKSASMLDALVEKCASVTIVDHHKTGIAVIDSSVHNATVSEDYLSPVWRTRGGLFVNLSRDNTKSGALLTYDYFLKVVPPNNNYTVGWLNGWLNAIKRLAQYVSDRDLWTFTLPRSRELNEYIASVPYTFNDYWTLVSELQSVNRIASIGAAIRDSKMKIIKSLLANATTATRDDVSVVVCNIPGVFASDAGDVICTTPRFMFVGYSFNDKENCYHAALRSSGTDIDVSAVAKLFDGGGHFNAAGCRIDALSHPSKIDWLSMIKPREDETCA